MQALVLVNIQIDFFPGGTMEIPGSQEIIPVINQLTDHFDVVVATKVWHPANHVSFAANHPWRRPGQVIRVADQDQPLRPMHCVQDTFGSEFVPELKTDKIREIFYLGTDPAVDQYSGFYDQGRQRSTGLEAYLQQMKVQTVFIAGVSLENTVSNTALDARAAGFTAYLIRDAVRSARTGEEDGDESWTALKNEGVAFTFSGALPR